MNKQVLQLKYHPAKKEIMFTLMNSGKKTSIIGTSRSVLAKYINEKGHFVLQKETVSAAKEAVKDAAGIPNIIILSPMGVISHLRISLKKYRREQQMCMSWGMKISCITF